ncbi:MAG: type III-B CRISPR module-associated protein Cmr5 [bacterium]|nr:type III-B CRISPR module-associated protein Cmr5 [bacterium]
MLTKSQRFAAVVMPDVLTVANSDNLEHKKQYKSLSKKAGSLVRNSGLIQTLAFLRARDQEHHQTLLQHLEQELQQMNLLPHDATLYDTVLSAEVPQYMVLTREILLLLNWHKRLAETLIIIPSANEQHGQEEVPQ